MILLMAEIFLVIFLVFLVRLFLQHNLPRPGGKVGRLRTIDPPAPVPAGFSLVYGRAITVFAASSETRRFRSLKAFLRHGTVQHPALMRVYRVAGCMTDIEIPAETPNYDRIDAIEALALLRELPDLRFIRRLQLSDEPCYLDPWLRAIHGPQFLLLGNATKTGVVVLYRPDRRKRNTAGLTLLHEWLHVIALNSPRDLRRFKRASDIEQLTPLSMPTVSVGIRETAIHEAWADLGERLFGYDEAVARDAALAAPMHAMVLWQRVEGALRQAPPDLRSTRFAELQTRAAFVRAEVAPKARPVAKQRRLWAKPWPS
jgi:hypothetical protein